MNGIDYLELLKLAAPEAILVATALLLLAIDLLRMRRKTTSERSAVACGIAAAGCLAAIVWLGGTSTQASALGGMLVIDGLTRLAKIALLVLTLFTLILSMQGRFTEHVGEYFAMLLMGTVGMLFLVSSEELLMIFLSLELTSLSLYVLTAFNKQDRHSAEAALKYFLFGGMAAAFTLFGFSLVYGLSGSTNLRDIAGAFAGRTVSPLVLVALIMTVIGFGFKVAAVPFHLWAPDAYYGAPTPSAAFIASGSKVASFFILAKVMMVGFDGLGGSGGWQKLIAGWMPILAIVAAFSMVLGNLAALAQRNVKRLLAYSAVAHAGYALMGVLADNGSGISSLVYYVITYALTALGAFGVVSIVEQSSGRSQFSDFAGLGRRAPVLALCMMVFMLSLAGIPPLAGFIGKFYLFAAAAAADDRNLGLIWLVTLAIAMSAVSLYYYLQVLKQIYVVDAPSGVARLQFGGLPAAAVVLLAVLVLVLGCAPGLLLDRLAALTMGGW